MNRFALVLLTLLLATRMSAQQPAPGPLLTKPLSDIPGKEGTLLTVTFAPGASGQVHRHNAHVFVYVLEGQIVMQVKGGKEETLGPGQTFYESPADIHAVGRNASDTAPARFLVFMVKDLGGPISVPVP